MHSNTLQLKLRGSRVLVIDVLQDEGSEEPIKLNASFLYPLIAASISHAHAAYSSFKVNLINAKCKTFVECMCACTNPESQSSSHQLQPRKYCPCEDQFAMLS